MNHSRYMLQEQYSPYPVKRRVTLKKNDQQEPAITILPPDPYMLINAPELPRPISPSFYRTAPPKAAKSKKSSFVILGETITTPVNSRPPSPSGRVSPFRGHGFKSPATSRSNSRSGSPTASPAKTEGGKTIKKGPDEKPPRYGRDIGLPPKSPKKIAKPQLTEFQPTSPKKPSPNPVIKTVKVRQAPNENKEKLKIVNEKPTGKSKPPVPPKKVGLKSILKNPTTPQPNRREIKTNETIKNEKNIKKESKPAGKSPAEIKSTKEPPKTTSEPKNKDAAKPPSKKPEPEIRITETTPEKAPQSKAENGTKKPEAETKPQKSESKPEAITDISKEAVTDSKEKLIPCFQPDKCNIAPPTMASPSPTTTPTISTPSTTPNATLSSLKNSESITTAAPTITTPANVNSVPSVIPPSEVVKKRQTDIEREKFFASMDDKQSEVGKVEKVTVTSTTTETVQVVQRLGSATSIKSIDEVPSTARSSMVTIRAASNGSIKSNSKTDVPGETMTTTKMITADPDVEVLSPNNLLNSPPHRIPNVAWDEERIPNGDVPSGEIPKSRIRRFFDALWRFLSCLFCCRCFPCCQRHQSSRFQCCRKIKCPKSKCCKKSDEPAPPSRCNCFAKCKDSKCCKCCSSCKCCSCLPNIFKCCKTDSGCCKKLKCCEGGCCKKKPKTTSKSTKCCAKMSCSCKNCCDNVKNCCLDCRDRVNNCCRSLFCLNLLCCQRCLRKCKCCHKFKCCQKGGCCSCCNPNVKRETRKRAARLDKKISRTSTHSKKDRENLDQVLVEHASLMKAAIPVLPTCLAVLCLIFNLLLPGSGTLFSGIFCLCFGKPRFSVKDTPQNRLGSFCLNIVIAIAQLFTVIFCLVGWGWSIWWGVIMYKLARKQKRLKLAEKNQQQEGGSSNVNQNHVDVEQG